MSSHNPFHWHLPWAKWWRSNSLVTVEEQHTCLFLTRYHWDVQDWRIFLQGLPNFFPYCVLPWKMELLSFVELRLCFLFLIHIWKPLPYFWRYCAWFYWRGYYFIRLCSNIEKYVRSRSFIFALSSWDFCVALFSKIWWILVHNDWITFFF